MGGSPDLTAPGAAAMMHLRLTRPVSEHRGR